MTILKAYRGLMISLMVNYTHAEFLLFSVFTQVLEYLLPFYIYGINMEPASAGLKGKVQGCQSAKVKKIICIDNYSCLSFFKNAHFAI